MIAYLSGPIENAHNDGADWRMTLLTGLIRVNHQVFNPVAETKSNQRFKYRRFQVNENH